MRIFWAISIIVAFFSFGKLFAMTKDWKNPNKTQIIENDGEERRLPSYKFNKKAILTTDSSKTFDGVFYVENGIRSWLVTENGISKKYRSYFHNSRIQFMGKLCSESNLDDGKSSTPIYICNEGREVYIAFTDATVKFYNEDR